MNMIKLSVLKNRLSGILSVGLPSFSVVSGILSVGNPNISVVTGILSVVGIPSVPIPEEIQLLMQIRNAYHKINNFNIIFPVINSEISLFRKMITIIFLIKMINE
jgi:hypothetical protein